MSHDWLPYNRAHKVDGQSFRPSLRSAAVDWKTLAVTFNANLDTGSVPAPSAFRVTVNGARRAVAAGGVAISGADVLLTLASAVTRTDTVNVRYTRPSTKPLQGTSGNAVETFTDQAVNNIPWGGWAATLTVGRITSTTIGCDFDLLPLCHESQTLTSREFEYGGKTYLVRSVAFVNQGDTLFYIWLDSAWPAILRNAGSLHVGGTKLSLADAEYSFGGAAAVWEPAPVNFAAGDEVSLCLTTGSDCPGGAGGDSGAADSVSVTDVSVVSGAGPDKTYGLGETINVRVTFTEAVDVTGAPRLKIDMDPAEWGEKWAAYKSGSGTSSLTFAHEVVEPNISTQGIAVLANTLELNGGTIRSGGTDGALAHTGLGHDANHKVDWQTEPEEEGGGGGGDGGVVGLSGLSGDSGPPSVTAVSVVSDPGDDKTYLQGDKIQVRATFSEAVTVTGSPGLKIDMDPAAWGEKRAAYESGSGTRNLTFSHTVVEPNYSTQGIAVLANTLALGGGTIRSSSGTNAALAHSGLGHAGARDYRIGWRLTSVIRGDPGFEVSLDATRRELANDNGAGTPVEHGVMLRAGIRW